MQVDEPISLRAFLFELLKVSFPSDHGWVGGEGQA